MTALKVLEAFSTLWDSVRVGQEAGVSVKLLKLLLCWVAEKEITA